MERSGRSRASAMLRTPGALFCAILFVLFTLISMCGALARRALKEPAKSAALRTRDTPKMIVEKWSGGRVIECEFSKLFDVLLGADDLFSKA